MAKMQKSHAKDCKQGSAKQLGCSHSHAKRSEEIKYYQGNQAIALTTGLGNSGYWASDELSGLFGLNLTRNAHLG